MMKKISLPVCKSEMFDSLQEDFTKKAPQNELKSFVTMETYWVRDLTIGLAFDFVIC